MSEFTDGYAIILNLFIIYLWKELTKAQQNLDIKTDVLIFMA